MTQEISKQTDVALASDEIGSQTDSPNTQDLPKHE